MNKKTKRQILIFTEALGYVENAHIDHGTVYANFKNKEDAISYRKDLANFMNDFFNLSLYSDRKSRKHLYGF